MLDLINGLNFNNIFVIAPNRNRKQLNGEEDNITYITEEEERIIEDSHDRVIDNTFSNRLKIKADKFINSVTIYPAKGLKGDKNANFYEFLSMGSIPYILGSATMIATFVGLSNHYEGVKTFSKKYGVPMALGVLGFGIAKTLAPYLISEPVKWSTGVDVNLPYKKIVNELPTSNDKPARVAIEYHKVFESVDFPRTDLLYDYDKYGNKYGSYYDYVAKKMGLGENLPVADQAVKPRLKSLLAKEKASETIISYFWAATAVVFAMQKAWTDLIVPTSRRKLDGNFLNKTKQLSTNIGTAFVESAKSMWKSGVGKTMVIASTLATLIGIGMTLHDGTKNVKDNPKNRIDYDKKYMVN